MKHIVFLLLLAATALPVMAQKDCPPNDKPDGTQKKPPAPVGPIGSILAEVIRANDPNEIIGPDGVADKKWVSVNDRMPYSILFQNNELATAPAKVVKITCPIDPRQDANTFQLGSFSFNNLSFNVPANTNAYYQRLDARDSLGLYVDITAGLDGVSHQAFWIFESIDPVTLLPTANPLKGFLLQPDSAQPAAGHGMVNFSIKPLASAHTGDTTSPYASIIFDTNDTIPTNRAYNTIDAVAPGSHFRVSPNKVGSNLYNLSWNGTDDPGGSGLASYSLYVSVNGRGYQLYQSAITDTSVLFTGLKDTTYCFFIAAKDSVGNQQPLSNQCDLSLLVSTSLPLTWLDFTGTRQKDDALLTWYTASEKNVQLFTVERSTDGILFSAIGTVTATGGTTGVNTYHFTDPGIVHLGANIIYYRIKEYDQDGRFDYSKTIAIRVDNNATRTAVNAFPNPFNSYIVLEITTASLQDKTNNVELYSLEGALLYRKTLGKQGSNTTILNDLPALTPGMYILKTVVNGTPYTNKLIRK